MKKALTVYKASAGSGKTFALAVQYIKLVVQNPQAYRNILAVTFTNKATEEMKLRILSQLYGIWKQLPDSDVYAKAVREALNGTKVDMHGEKEETGAVSPELVSRNAGIALNLLLHNYNHFRVMTIDTFFQSVVRNMARELDLAANLHVGLNDNQVEEMAVDELINDLDTSDAMLQWIMNYIMENIADDRSWNVIGGIKQFGKTIFRDFYKDIGRQLDERLSESGFFERYATSLRQLIKSSKERMSEMGQTFFETLESEGLSIDDLSNKRRGIASFFLKLQNGVFDESIENQTVANCLGDPTKWYTKTHPRREIIHALADGTLGSLLRQAVEERPRHWRLYQSATLTLRHLNQVRLLSSIERKVRELNADANRFLLSDTQKLLNALISNSDSPFIFEKIGTQLEHIMIDEFQDTSTAQWENFRVLLLETMSHRGSENLIVGDVKQSIYRWRSGDWRLLNGIEQEFPEEMLEITPLRTNRRSARHIVAFNNHFFAEAARLEYLNLDDMPGAGQLQRAYQEVEQLIADDKPAEGYVNIRLLKTDDYQAETLSQTADIIRELLSRQITQNKIAILVRTNSYIPLIANYMAEHCPEVSIVSDEAFRLDASRAVNIIVQALQYLLHPNDQIALAYLERSCGNVTAIYERAETLRQMPLYELVTYLFSALRLNRFTDEGAYICAFFDQLNKFANENIPSIDGFIREWNDTLCAKTIQSDQTDGIRIISIHKSKGLEYDHVICTFCDWQLEITGNVLWCRPTEEPFSELPIAPIDYSAKAMKGTIYEHDYQEEHLQNVVDNLNLLYVAFTRARRSLYVVGRRGARNSRSELIEQVLPLLRDGTLTGQDDEEQTLEYSLGEKAEAGKSQQEEKSRNVFLQQAEQETIRVTAYDVKAEFRQSNQSREFVSDDDEQASATSYIQLGNILHRVFSTIRTSADIDDALYQLETEGVLYDNQLTLERITTMLRKRLEHPQVADWFTDRWKLFNECTILSMEDDEVREHRPDRVMTDGNEWIVVDFKFGRPRDEYHEQVRRYMSLLMQMGHDNVRGYLWFVYSNKIEEVNFNNNHSRTP